MIKCTNCNKNTAVYDSRYGYIHCIPCQLKPSTLSKPPEFYSQRKADRVTKDRDKNARDMIQPWVGGKPNPEFAKAFPQHAKMYFSKKELKKL